MSLTTSERNANAPEFTDHGTWCACVFRRVLLETQKRKGVGNGHIQFWDWHWDDPQQMHYTRIQNLTAVLNKHRKARSHKNACVQQTCSFPTTTKTTTTTTRTTTHNYNIYNNNNNNNNNNKARPPAHWVGETRKQLKVRVPRLFL